MLKFPFIALTLTVASALSLQADQLVTLTLNTASLSGTTGSVDFAFNAGALTSQSATAVVFNLAGASFAGTQVQTGAATGGPINAPIFITNNGAFQSNDDFEAVKFGNTLSFTLDLSGPAVNSPTGQGLSTSQFGFYVYSDAAGSVPALGSNASGLAGLVTANLNGTLSSTPVSPNLNIAGVPEPATPWLVGSVLGFCGLVRLRRRSVA